MQMLIDAALITRKAASLDYNTDSVNASGKIWPREIVHSEKGILAAGPSQGKPYYALADAPAKGTAESAVDLFKSCVAEFSPDGSNYSEKIGGFFRAFSQVLAKTGYESNACNLAVFAGYEDRIFCAKSGNSRIFRYADGDFFEVKPQLFPHEDGLSSYGVSVYNNVRPGEIYVLTTGQVAEAVTESLLKAIVNNAGGDIKKIVSMIVSNALKNGCTDAVSAIVLKVAANNGQQDGAGAGTESQHTAAPAAAAAAAPAAASAVLREVPEQPEPAAVPATEGEPRAAADRSGYYEPSEEEIDEERDETDKIIKYKTRNKFIRAAIIDIAIVAVVIVGVIAILFAKGVIGPNKYSDPVKDGVNVSDSLDDLTTTKKAEQTTKKQAETTTEATTAAQNTQAAQNGGSTQRTTARAANVTPTRAPSTTRSSYTPATEPDEPDPVTTPEPPATEPPASEPPATEPPATETPRTEAPPQTSPPAPTLPDDPDVYVPSEDN